MPAISHHNHQLTCPALCLYMYLLCCAGTAKWVNALYLYAIMRLNYHFFCLSFISFHIWTRKHFLFFFLLRDKIVYVCHFIQPGKIDIFFFLLKQDFQQVQFLHQFFFGQKYSIHKTTIQMMNTCNSLKCNECMHAILV